MKFDKLINNTLNEDHIIGGLSAGKNINDIAKKWKVDIDVIQKAIDAGIKVEMEHTNSEAIAKEIAMDHLWELGSTYYTELKKMEDKIKSAKSVKENANLAGSGGSLGTFAQSTGFSADTYAPGDARVPKVIGAKDRPSKKAPKMGPPKAKGLQKKQKGKGVPFIQRSFPTGL